MSKLLWTLSLFILAMVAATQSAVSQIRQVKVTGGEVKGDESQGIVSFKGIPFAAPPVKELRWKSPQPVTPWNGVKKANSFAPACMQILGNMAKISGSTDRVSEDCLYLNVWTAAKNENEKRPVLVWIYGGGFTSGMTSLPMYDGSNLAQKGVVLVSVAYRVGPFGFLAHPDLSRESGKGSGNYGLQDAIAGLQWVKENIAQFGGDPSCVTIFGQSAGGTVVSMLTASPAAKGLFHRAISQSGGSFAPPRSGNEAGQNVPTLGLAESKGKEFLEKLGASDITAARALSANKIQNSPTASVTNHFWPVADGDVLPGDQYELYLAGRFNDTPILVGTNSDEGGSFARGTVTAKEFEMRIRNGFGPNAAALLSVYPHANDLEASQSSKDSGRDSVFAWPTWAWASLQSQKGKNKAYVYYFDHYNPSVSSGAGHGAEVSYVFGNFRSFGAPSIPMGAPLGGRGQNPPVPQYGGAMSNAPSGADKQLWDIMSSYWINFARSGDPNGPGLLKWPAFTDKESYSLIFGVNEIIARPLPNLEKLKAYDPYYARRRMEARKRAGISE
jgi:para-nitrobenzyl esterase